MIFTQKVNLIGIFVCSPYGQINKIILLPLLDFCLRHLVCLSISQIERVPHPAQCACNAHLVRLFNKCCVAAVMLEIHTEKQLSEFYCSSCQWLIELTIFSNEKKNFFQSNFIQIQQFSHKCRQTCWILQIMSENVEKFH